MKATVLRLFRDKNTKKVYKPGMMIDLPKERIDEILSVNKALLKVEEVKKEVKKQEKKKK